MFHWIAAVISPLLSFSLGRRCTSTDTLFVSNLKDHFHGLVQERRNSTANTLELRLSCTNPSIWSNSIWAVESQCCYVVAIRCCCNDDWFLWCITYNDSVYPHLSWSCQDNVLCLAWDHTIWHWLGYTALVACLYIKNTQCRQALWWYSLQDNTVLSLIARLLGPTWGPSGADRPHVGPMNFPIWNMSL